jgi:hypothetical protein
VDIQILTHLILFLSGHTDINPSYFACSAEKFWRAWLEDQWNLIWMIVFPSNQNDNVYYGDVERTENQ